MSSDFKKLAINREKIDSIIGEYPGISKLKKQIMKKDGTFIKYEFCINDKTANLDVYYRADGGTTFTPSGKEKEISISIAGFLKANCTKGDGSTKSIRIANFPEEGKDLLFDFLKEECDAQIEDAVEHQHGEKYTIIGKNSDTVVFWIYTNGACHLQGRQFSVFTDILEMLAEILDYKTVIQSQLKTIKVDLSSKEALDDMKQLLPTTFEYFENKLKAIVSPALALKKLDIELTDYTSFVFPVLRGLEGYLKQVLNDFDIFVGKEGFGELIETDKYGNYVLSIDTKSKIANAGKESALLNLYKYINKHRHSLFHVDGVIEATKTIDNKEDAIALIDSTISLIEDSHRKLF